MANLSQKYTFGQLKWLVWKVFVESLRSVGL